MQALSQLSYSPKINRVARAPALPGHRLYWKTLDAATSCRESLDGIARCHRHSGTLIFSLFIIFCSPNRDSPNAAAAFV